MALAGSPARWCIQPRARQPSGVGQSARLRSISWRAVAFPASAGSSDVTEWPSAGPFFVDETGLFPAGGMRQAAGIQIQLHIHYLIDLQPGQSGSFVYGWGLMALPSLHVAAVTLYALFAWGEGRFMRWLTILFAVCIFLGSLLSGWHYAIDGYAGALIAAALWYGVGWAQGHRIFCHPRAGGGPPWAVDTGSGPV